MLEQFFVVLSGKHYFEYHIGLWFNDLFHIGHSLLSLIISYHIDKYKIFLSAGKKIGSGERSVAEASHKIFTKR